ncbi:hypothetical protein IR073_06780 [Gemella sp. 19428wG2_WT2a]|nr:hypothetical protein [Gemella sp. 19428wG2_WT2a]TFU57539.1 hypothetical protein E4T67_06700 [Gemella sp. WT2a]
MLTKKQFILRSSLLLLAMLIFTGLKIDLILKEKIALLVGGIAFLIIISTLIAHYRYLDKMGIFYSLKEMKYLFSTKDKFMKYRRSSYLRFALLLIVVVTYFYMDSVPPTYIIAFSILFLVSLTLEIIEHNNIKKALGY